MLGARTLYFPEVGPVWEDWVQVINVGSAPTKVLAIARHSHTGQPVWSEEKTIDSFECWTPNVEAVKEKPSMQFSADEPIVAERHMHKGTNVLDFVGAAVEYETVGLRLFFPELVSGAWDWFRFLNVGETDALINMVIRNRNGDVIRQHQHTNPSLRCWEVDERVMGNTTGTVKVQSTQAIVGERHLHYRGRHAGAVVGEYGVVIGE
ncbi:MAG: hypothetical protein O7E52_03415 [Candidatus Poribacteria bacterium]|nr:hypothetical protein [Candidatus Poribacteria bacterium]